MRPLILISMSAFIFIAGCRKDKLPKKEKFLLTYQFINEGDANVSGVVLYTTTFFPNDTIDATGDSVSIINWHNQAFSNVGAHDIVNMPVTKLGYAGCSVQFQLIVNFKNMVFSPIRFENGWGPGAIGMTYSRIFDYPLKIITSPADNIIKFKWPSDTANYKELLRR